MVLRLPLALLLAILAAVVTGNVVAAEPSVIPKPRSMTLGKGEFVFDAHTRIEAPKDERAQEIAAWLRDALASDTGIGRSGDSKKGGLIRLKFDRSIKGDEAYHLDVGSGRITLEASNARGLFWAAQTLRQLVPQAADGRASIPALRIQDAPQFSYRGHMLDVGRHFLPIEFVKKQIDLLSYYKINTFRWHLTEDQGWRIEIRKYPKLTEVGAWRTESDGSRYGGYYTQDQIRDVVEYARMRNIEVVPEIEMPGHATAALASYPELSCGKQPVAVSNSWGVKKDIYCVGDEFTFHFIEDVLDEVVALFPSQYVHVGGDEVPKDRWRESASSQERMREEGLTNEHELQSYFIRRVQSYLASKGKTLIGWDEILEGGANRDAVIEVWRGESEGAKALANGNRIVSAGQFYLDSPLKSLTVEKIYNTDIVPAAYLPYRSQVLGAEAPLWTERVNETNAEAMLYPRLIAFAETAWSAAPRNYVDFRKRLQSHYPRLQTWKVAYGPEDRGVADCQVAWDAAEQGWRINAERGFEDVLLHYTSDGSEPSANSPAFADSLVLHDGGVVTITPFRGDRPLAWPRGFTTVMHKAVGKPIRYSTPPNRNYRKGGDGVLVDGLRGGDAHSDGLWTGWQGEDMTATIDLEQVTPVREISARFLQQSGSWILFPKAVRYLVSIDGQNWKRVYERNFQVDALNDERQLVDVQFQARQSAKARYVRVEVDRYGLLPAGHNGAGSPAYFFIDEIVVR